MSEGVGIVPASAAVVEGNGDTNPENALAMARFAMLSEAQLNRMVEGIGRAIEARKKIAMVCVRAAEPKDFLDFGGRPYLQGPGAQRIMSAAGISMSAPEWGDVEWSGDDALITVAAEFYWPPTGCRIVEIGSCSTRDKFFVPHDGQEAKNPGFRFSQYLAQVNGDRALAKRMLSLDVRKKAYSNLIARGVAAVMGLKALTWERLEEYGFQRTEGVKFRKGSESTEDAVADQGPRSSAPVGGNGKEVPFVKLADVAGLAVGSVVMTGGWFLETTESSYKDKKTGEQKPLVKVVIGDDTTQLNGAMAKLPDDFDTEHPWTFRVKVGSYKGNPDLWVFEATAA